MYSPLLKPIFLALVASCAFSAHAASPDAADSTDRMIVKYRSQGTARALLQRDLSARSESIAAGRHGFTFSKLKDLHGGARVLKLNKRVSVAQLRELSRELMAEDPDVEYAEPDLLNFTTATSNDSRISEQWGFKDSTAGSNVFGAWDLATGSGVRVAVLDTGPDNIESSSDDKGSRGTGNRSNQVLEPRGLVVVLQVDEVRFGNGRATEQLDLGVSSGQLVWIG